MAARSRSFVYTFNNYTADDETAIQAQSCRYHVYGRELAPTTGTRHLQGYIVFPNARSLASVRSSLGCHVEVARGSPAQCKDYCSKEDPSPFEYGECPASREDAGAREKARWDAALAAAKADKIEEIPADITIRYYGALQRIRTDYGAKPGNAPGTTGIWIHGLAGCGKTRTVFEKYPDAYPKGLNKWWCGYKLEPVVLLDDIDPSHGSWSGHLLKKWADRYPFIGESKGGSRQIRPLKFIVTSQYKIEEIFQDKETREALNRRFVVIEKFIGQNIII